MRAVLQRVSEASVTVDGAVTGAIGRGWLALVGVAEGDGESDADWLAEKTVRLRAFPDDQGKMNLCVSDIGGEVLAVSQFTLLADCRAGRRPSFISAADPALAERLYQRFMEQIGKLGIPVAAGVFRAEMKVALINDGPVTFLLDSRKP